MPDESTQSITIDADPAQVMAVIADFANYPVWTGSVKRAEVLETGPDGRARRVAFSLDAGIIRACWLSRDEIAARSDELRSPMVLRGVDDFLTGRHLPLDTVVAIPNGHPA